MATPKKPVSDGTKVTTNKKPVAKGSLAKTIDANKFSPKMTPEDIAMKKLLEKKYGKIYG